MPNDLCGMFLHILVQINSDFTDQILVISDKMSSIKGFAESLSFSVSVKTTGIDHIAVLADSNDIFPIEIM